MPAHDRIPREIFEIILHHCVGFKTPVRDLVTLQLVCRTWHDIIANTSFLWGTISTKEGSRAFHKSFRMAKNSPLYIEFNGKNKIEASEFFSLAAQRIDQWRGLAIEADTVRAALATIQTQKPPKLDLLYVKSRWYISSDEIVIFGGAPATGLKHIRLIKAPINLPSLHLSGLESLLLEHIPSITAADIITILNNSPILKILHLIGLNGTVLPTAPATDEPHFPFTSPIRLAFLIDLKFYHPPLPFLNFLLSSLAVPRLRSLYVVTSQAKQPVAQLLDVGMRHQDPVLISLTSGAQEYNVTISYDGILEIVIGGLTIDLTSLTQGRIDRFEETFKWLCEHLEGVALAEMPLHLTLEGWDPMPLFLEWFARRTSVTWLTLIAETLDGQGYDLMDMIPLLSRPTSGPSPIWLLPQLEVFETNLARTEDDRIVDMIKARHAVLPESFPGLHGPPPKRLREIRLSHQEDTSPTPSSIETFMSEVTRAAEGAEVYWLGRKWTEWPSARLASTPPRPR